MEQGSRGELRASALINVAPARGEPPAAAAGREPREEQPHGGEEPSGGSVSLGVSTKPLIGVLWLGCAVAGVGSLLAVVRRFREGAEV
jgi:hypothetical protein